MFNKKKKQQEAPYQDPAYGKPFGEPQYPAQPQVPDSIVNPQYFMAPDGTAHSAADLAFQPAPVTAPTFLNQQNPSPFPPVNNQEPFGMAQPNQPNAFPAPSGQQSFGQPYPNDYANQPPMAPNGQQSFGQPYPNDYANQPPMASSGQQDFGQPYPNDYANQPPMASSGQQDFGQPYSNDYANQPPMAPSGQQDFGQPYPNDYANQPEPTVPAAGMQDSMSGSGFWEDGSDS